MSKTTHKCLRKKYTVTLFHLLWKKKMKAFVNMDKEQRKSSHYPCNFP